MSSLLEDIYGAISVFSNKTPQQIKGNAKEFQLDVLTRVVTTLLGKNSKVLRNVYVPYAKDTKTTEVDMILLMNGNIFVFEVKNYSCTIVGKQSEKDWKTIYTKDKTYTMYNPIMQNRGHISTLATYLKISEDSIYSVIVFSEDADISKVQYSKSSKLTVTTMTDIVNTITKLSKNKPKYSKQQMDTLYQAIKPLTKVSKAVKEQHIKDVSKDRH